MLANSLSPRAPRRVTRVLVLLLGSLLAMLVIVPPASAAETTVTLQISDGFDGKQGKTLSADGTLGQVQTSNNNRFGVEDKYWLSLQFQRTVPAGATIVSAKLAVERYEESGHPPGAITWEAGGGALNNPSAATSFKPPLLIGESAEAVVEWDVTAAANTPAKANDLKMVIRNANGGGKKSYLDHVRLVVRYSDAPVTPTAPIITSTPGTTAVVGSPYRYQAAASGSTPITWDLPTAPAGMTVDANTGLVSWTPAAAGSFPVLLRATNSVGANTQDTQDYTVAVTAAAASVTLLAAGDVADCNSTGDSATAALLAQNSGTVAALGDLAYESGTATEFANCYQPTWGAHKARTKPVPGNHEYNTSGAGPYYDYFGAAAGTRGQGYYSYDVGAWHVVALNSEANFGSTSTQLTWLRNDLAANTKNCTLAYWHKPRFTAGNYSDFTAYQPFWQALYDANAEVVLAGHDHNYQRYRPMTPTGAADTTRGIREFVVGTGGRGHYGLRTDSRREAGNDTAFGVLKLTLRGGGYDWNFLPVSGASYTDSGSGTCH